jgi:hypothetical protein
MANVIDYYLDVLATSPAEINSIEERLKQPSAKLVEWVAPRWEQSIPECAENVKALVSFKPVRNLFYVHPSVNKARCFHIEFKRVVGVVNSHLHEVSAEFPSALFMLEYIDMMSSYSGKKIILAGNLIAETFDEHQKAQAIEWTLVDIFAPFRAEYDLDLPFGSLWDKWLDDLAAKGEELKAADERWWLSKQANRREPTSLDDQPCPKPVDVTFNDTLPERCPIPSAPKHLIERELRDGVFRTLCNLCHNPIPAVVLDGKSWAVPEVPLAEPVCFEVTPCNVGLYQPEHEDKPRTHVERWRKLPEKIVVCADCWARCVPSGK